MKKVLKLTLALAMMMSASSLFAQKFGRIDTSAILVAMPETKEMQSSMETFVASLRETLETMQVEYNNKVQEFQKNLNTWSEAISQVKQKDLVDLQGRIEEYQRAAAQDIQNKEIELRNPIIEKAKAAIDKVAAANGYLAVFDTSMGSLAYFDEAALTDIAPLVRAELGIKEEAAN